MRMGEGKRKEEEDEDEDWEAGEMARPENCLLCNPEGLNAVPRILIRSWAWRQAPLIPTRWRQRQAALPATG